ncbi:MAG: hypothetical protein ACK5X0_18850, partial [Rhodospirillales bacterium]
MKAAAGTLAATSAGFAMAAGRLAWRHMPAGETGFYRAPVLLSGGSEAMLIDGGFTYSDGRKVVEAIRATGKTLTTIYVSQSDPDYYFSLKPITTAFPNARVLAASATIAAIRGNVEKKLAVWGPQLKDNVLTWQSMGKTRQQISLRRCVPVAGCRNKNQVASTVQGCALNHSKP